MALTGLFWMLFLLGHLSANLLLYSGDPDLYNVYSERLVGLGPLLVAAEVLLVLTLLFHVFAALDVTFENRRGRTGRYALYRSRGRPSRMTLSSRTMIWTGLVVAVFLPVHVYTFKYGPGLAEGYAATVGGEQVRDLRRLVLEAFENPWYLAFYLAALVLLGLHLRHAFWSAFQSLGLHHRRLTPLAYWSALGLAALLAGGFLSIPLWVFAGGPQR